MRKNVFRCASVLLGLCCFLFSFGQQRVMTWTSKSKQAKEETRKGVEHLKNFEYAQAYHEFLNALEYDPDFTIPLVFMATLTDGETRKKFMEKASRSARSKSEGEKILASIVSSENSYSERRSAWSKLFDMFPDDRLVGAYYVISRATAREQMTAAMNYQKRFPEEPCMYNLLGYFIFHQEKDTAAAKSYFEKYLQLYPEGCNAYDSMGEFYLMTGDLEKAEEYYQLALEKYPFYLSSIQKLREIKEMKDKGHDHDE